MVHPGNIRVITICVFRHGDRILVLEGFDRVKRNYYYRPLGGAVEFGETAQEAIVREIREEIGQEITGLRLIGIIENLFTCDGIDGHEIVFVYDARFTDETVYNNDRFTGFEEKTSFTASWCTLDSFDNSHRLVPEQLMDILNKKGDEVLYCQAMEQDGN
jgi:ADP-ribose pyrophosphatase YjhB (NUDIX family)